MPSAVLARIDGRGYGKVRGLGEAPLPLFVAAAEREDVFSLEGVKPGVALVPMTDGREGSRIAARSTSRSAPTP